MRGAGQHNSFPWQEVAGSRKRYCGDEFNNSYKHERNLVEEEEFACSDTNESHRVVELKNLKKRVHKKDNLKHHKKKKKKQEKKEQQEKKRQEKKKQEKKKNFIKKVIMMTAGAIIITNNYQHMVAARNQEMGENTNLPDTVIESEPPADGSENDPVQDNDMPQNNNEMEPSAQEDEQKRSKNGEPGEEQRKDNDDSQEEPTSTESADKKGTEKDKEKNNDKDKDKEKNKNKDKDKPTNAPNSEDKDKPTNAPNSEDTDKPTDAPNSENTDKPTNAPNSEDTGEVKVSWTWSENNESATVEITDSSGNVKKIPAEISVTEQPASCTVSGKRTYKATANVDGKIYTDMRDETIPATGHKFDEGTKTKREDGKIVMEYICENCQQHFVIEASISDEK